MVYAYKHFGGLGVKLFRWKKRYRGAVRPGYGNLYSLCRTNQGRHAGLPLQFYAAMVGVYKKSDDWGGRHLSLQPLFKWFVFASYLINKLHVVFDFIC